MNNDNKPDIESGASQQEDIQKTTVPLKRRRPRKDTAQQAETLEESPKMSRRRRTPSRRTSSPKKASQTEANVSIQDTDVFKEPLNLPSPELISSYEDSSLTEGPFTFDENDEELPVPTQRRRTKRTRKNSLAEKTAEPAQENSEKSDEDITERKRGRVKEKAGTETKVRIPPHRGLMKMLISVIPGDEVEVVLTEDGKVCEYYVEMMHQAKIRGNIYKAIITNIDANLQAAFVNYGVLKSGFLQIDEVHPDYYLQPHEVTKGHRFPPVQKALKPGQEVLVQVVKEPMGSKGASLTTWISLAGRFLVLTPGQEEIGISRKVEDAEERSRLRELIKGINPGQGMGVIVRTVSAGTNKTTLQKDLSYLKRLWKDIRKRATAEKAPALIYQEMTLASRAVRDYLSDDITEVWVDDEQTANDLREIASLLFPRKTDLVHLYENERETLWEHFGIRHQLEEVHAREIFMPSGGRLVFDQTEALMAIDVNSGRISGKNNFEAMSFRTNMEAAAMIAEQLRLRDIGGQIVIDFIEMREPEHCHAVETTIRDAMRWDRARHDIGKMSSFGLLQIVRQRTASSAISTTLEVCPYCNGTGQRHNLEWRAIQAMRDLDRTVRQSASTGESICFFTVTPDLGLYILNHKRDHLTWLEKKFGIAIEIKINQFADTTSATPSNRYLGRNIPLSQMPQPTRQKKLVKKKKPTTPALTPALQKEIGESLPPEGTENSSEETESSRPEGRDISAESIQ